MSIYKYAQVVDNTSSRTVVCISSSQLFVNIIVKDLEHNNNGPHYHQHQ